MLSLAPHTLHPKYKNHSILSGLWALRELFKSTSLTFAITLTTISKTNDYGRRSQNQHSAETGRRWGQLGNVSGPNDSDIQEARTRGPPGLHKTNQMVHGARNSEQPHCR